VRFLLTVPEEAMATQPDQPRRVRERQIIVLPTAAKDEEKKLGTASSWNRSHLKDLGVNFNPKGNRIDLNGRVLKVKETDWTPELRARIPPILWLMLTVKRG
jgi:hypothetical protein